METQLDTETFEAVEAQLARFAEAGSDDWRHDARLDSALLASLPAVQARLVAGGGVPPADQERDAIEAAIEGAIDALPQPFAQAARDYFGFTRPAAAKTKREERAGKTLSYTGRWFRKPTSRYFGLTPREFVVALTTASLCEAPDPLRYVTERLAPAESDGPNIQAQAHDQSEAPEPPRRRARRRPLAVASVLLAAGGIGLVLYLGHGHNAARAHQPAGYIPAKRAVFACAREPSCIGPSYPVFNSYTDAPRYGDERDFLNVRPARSSTSTFFNALNVTRGEHVLLRVYYDNDGDPRAEPRPGYSSARDVHAMIVLPYARGRHLTVAGSITAANTIPRTVGDTVMLRGSAPFNLVYVPGTARLWNRAHPHGLRLPNALFAGTGAELGYAVLNGTITGCFCQAGLITAELLVE